MHSLTAHSSFVNTVNCMYVGNGASMISEHCSYVWFQVNRAKKATNRNQAGTTHSVAECKCKWSGVCALELTREWETGECGASDDRERQETE